MLPSLDFLDVFDGVSYVFAYLGASSLLVVWSGLSLCNELFKVSFVGLRHTPVFPSCLGAIDVANVIRCCFCCLLCLAKGAVDLGASFVEIANEMHVI